MNLQDKNRLVLIKALLTLVFCLLAVAAGTDRESDRVTLNDSGFTSTQFVMNELAITATANYTKTVIHEIEIPFFKCISSIRKSIIDSNLLRNRVFVIGKLLENIVPQYSILSFLSLLRTNQDDAPDLSRI